MTPLELVHIMFFGGHMFFVYSRRREGKYMSEVNVRKNETLDSALRRFKRSCSKDGVIAELKRRKHYEKPSVKRKKKSEAARKRKF